MLAVFVIHGFIQPDCSYHADMHQLHAATREGELPLVNTGWHFHCERVHPRMDRAALLAQYGRPICAQC